MIVTDRRYPSTISPKVRSKLTYVAVPLNLTAKAKQSLQLHKELWTLTDAIFTFLMCNLLLLWSKDRAYSNLLSNPFLL